MIGRHTGGILGMLAFSVSIVVGLWAGNPVAVILSRAVWALCVFCVIGLLVGGVAQYVINDYGRRRYQQITASPENEASAEPKEEPINSSTEAEGKPMGT